MLSSFVPKKKKRKKKKKKEKKKKTLTFLIFHLSLNPRCQIETIDRPQISKEKKRKSANQQISKSLKYSLIES
jgi:hypothetical protein